MRVTLAATLPVAVRALGVVTRAARAAAQAPTQAVHPALAAPAEALPPPSQARSQAMAALARAALDVPSPSLTPPAPPPRSLRAQQAEHALHGHAAEGRLYVTVFEGVLPSAILTT